MGTGITHPEKVLILDFGSQYTQLIARRVRELGVYSEIQPYHYPVSAIERDGSVRAIILSGGPASVYAENAPRAEQHLFQLNLPVLGICYGLQHLVDAFGGRVAPARSREFGRAELLWDKPDPLLAGLNRPSVVWMSHGDRVEQLPESFVPVAYTSNSPYAAVRHKNLPIYGLQFHPEVHHTAGGKAILSNFLYQVAGLKGDWSPGRFIETTIADIRERVGSDRVLCALSGGVDSSVAAVLIHHAIGDQLTCVFVDTGLLRAGEADQVERTFRENFQINLIRVNARRAFLSKLAGVNDPEEKRRIIGRTFIEVFEQQAKELGDFKFLAQGTLYPDVIESVSTKGPSATIKTHHNVGGLPERLNFQLLEPFRELFKDEVRAVGRELGLPEEIIERHPFPGPGLAIRILGEVTPDRLEMLRTADTIYIQELKDAGLYRKIWQAFAVLLPVQTVGVMGDERTYENVLALRAVTSTDGMTADWFPMPHPFLARVSSRIINEVKGINRVVYDVSSKPPSTIEWE